MENLFIDRFFAESPSALGVTLNRLQRSEVRSWVSQRLDFSTYQGAQVRSVVLIAGGGSPGGSTISATWTQKQLESLADGSARIGDAAATDAASGSDVLCIRCEIHQLTAFPPEFIVCALAVLTP